MAKSQAEKKEDLVRKSAIEVSSSRDKLNSENDFDGSSRHDVSSFIYFILFLFRLLGIFLMEYLLFKYTVRQVEISIVMNFKIIRKTFGEIFSNH